MICSIVCEVVCCVAEEVVCCVAEEVVCCVAEEVVCTLSISHLHSMPFKKDLLFLALLVWKKIMSS